MTSGSPTDRTPAQFDLGPLVAAAAVPARRDLPRAGRPRPDYALLRHIRRVLTTPR